MNIEDNRFFGLCKCCLQDGCFRTLWTEYEEDGVIENYGNMLNECFALGWQKPSNEQLDQICDDCTFRAKEASRFRQMILASQDHLSGVQIKVEVAEDDGKIEFLSPQLKIVQQVIYTPNEEDPEYIVPEEYAEVEYLEDNDLLVENPIQDRFDDAEDSDDPEYTPPAEEVEYLDVDEQITGGSAKKQTVSQPQRKSKRKRKRKVAKSYRNYTADDLQNSIEAVLNAKMTALEASIQYNVPRKTIAARVLAKKKGIQPSFHYNRELVEEVRTLLTYTNMTPYKTRTAHLHCAYCSTFGPMFEDADELRTHTRTQHAGERTKSVEQFLRPQWLNEILRVDIENLHCTVCCTILVSWNDMFKHLKERHDLDFDLAYTRVVPFILGNNLRCALCKQAFPNYHHLDSHMNAHYNNYMCSECGDTFLSESRLKKHLKIHNTGRFVCGECGKTFLQDKYREKHIKLVHKQEENIKCLYCSEKFHGCYTRHLHVMKCHSEKVKVITCELCGKIFDWRPYYLAHLRRKHKNERNYKCRYCDKQFFMKSELTRHQKSHKESKMSQPARTKK